MSQEARHTKVGEQTQQLLEGPLKHVRAAALAAALLPLASVAATPAAAQQACFSAGICGFVWSDTNTDGIHDAGEPGIPGVTVTDTTTGTTTTTASDGSFFFGMPQDGPHVIQVVIPTGTQPTQPDAGSDDTVDSDGTPAGTNSVATAIVTGGENNDTDFGFVPEQSSGGTVPSPCDFLTSGGFVVTDGGKKVTFGIHGGCKHGEFWGHLNVVDHSTGYHINSTEVTGYLIPTGAASNVREICGLASTNKATDPSSVMFRVRLIDNGEPGSADLMGIRLSTGYHLSTRLLSAQKPGGGNIQLHDPNPSTTAPSGPAECWGVASPDAQ